MKKILGKKDYLHDLVEWLNYYYEHLILKR